MFWVISLQLTIIGSSHDVNRYGSGSRLLVLPLQQEICAPQLSARVNSGIDGFCSLSFTLTTSAPVLKDYIFWSLEHNLLLNGTTGRILNLQLKSRRIISTFGNMRRGIRESRTAKN
jgi:hypothetical protein